VAFSILVVKKIVVQRLLQKLEQEEMVGRWENNVEVSV
jgi:hypothetical protein